MQRVNTSQLFKIISGRLLFALLLIAALIPAYAQDAAQTLQISEADERAIMKDAHLSRIGEHYKIQGCDDPVSVNLQTVDLNSDGKPAVILTVFDSACFSGLMQSNVSVYAKTSKGKWREVLGFMPAFGVRVQSTRNKGYADLVLTVLGGCDPVYKWSGYSYMYSAKLSSYGQQCNK